jgi:hypothetical protein
VKLAATDAACSISTMQVGAVPEHAPDQPANSEPGSGSAVSGTSPPANSSRSQILSQSSLATVLVTEPDPVPMLDTSSENVDGSGVPKKPEPGA